MSGCLFFLWADSQSSYCPLYCLFLDQNGAQWMDSIAWIGSSLKSVRRLK